MSCSGATTHLAVDPARAEAAALHRQPPAARRALPAAAATAPAPAAPAASREFVRLIPNDDLPGAINEGRCRRRRRRVAASVPNNLSKEWRRLQARRDSGNAGRCRYPKALAVRPEERRPAPPSRVWISVQL